MAKKPRLISHLQPIDVCEDLFLEYDPALLDTLLADRSTGRNIIWGTDDYATMGEGYGATDQITADKITGANSTLISPRIKKSIATQRNRSKDKAEVFTPTWICNTQNNLVDEAWFGYKNVFNQPNSNKTNPHEYRLAPSKDKDPDQKVVFPDGKTWQEYVMLRRMEITCGEAPYLVNRYDPCSKGRMRVRRKVRMRVGMLDRKLRVICENATSSDEWQQYVIKAYQSIYGFEWQGDSLLLARENLLLTLLDFHAYQFGLDVMPSDELIKTVAEIISWNIWQMDGLTLQVPYTKKQKYTPNQLFGFENDVFCKIMDWENNQSIYFAELVKGGPNA